MKYLRILTKAAAYPDCPDPEDRRMLDSGLGQMTYGDQAAERLGLHSLSIETLHIPLEQVSFTESRSCEHVFENAGADFKPTRAQIKEHFKEAAEHAEITLHLPGGRDFRLAGDKASRAFQDFLAADDMYFDVEIPEGFFDPPKQEKKTGVRAFLGC